MKVLPGLVALILVGVVYLGTNAALNQLYLAEMASGDTKEYRALIEEQRAAQSALTDALERNASDEEIAPLQGRVRRNLIARKRYLDLISKPWTEAETQP